MNSNLRLLDDGIDDFLAQFVVNTSLLVFENIVTDGLTQVFQGLILGVTNLFGQFIVQLGNFFDLYLVKGNRVMGFFSGQVLISVVAWQCSSKFLALSYLHTYNMLIHTCKEPMAFLREFKGIIFQV